MVKQFLKEYLSQRPLFLSLIRARELELFSDLFKLNYLHPILDVGCGDGFFASVLMNNNVIPPETGIQGERLFDARSQIKTGMTKSVIDVGLDMPGSRMGEAGKLGVYKKLVEFDGVSMPFKSGSFQTVISNCVLEHVERLPELLREIYRVLKPGGRFVTTVMARPWEENLVGALLLGNNYRNYMRSKQVHLNLFTRDQWRKAFTNAGFAIARPYKGFSVRAEVGYLSPNACRLIDVCHYLSVPNLVSYKLFGKWVLTPGFPPYPVNWFSNILSEPVDSDKSGAIFYVLEKR